jgi:hypothetical protein
VEALIGMSLGNSNSSSSLVYCPFFPFLACNSLQLLELTFRSSFPRSPLLSRTAVSESIVAVVAKIFNLRRELPSSAESEQLRFVGELQHLFDLFVKAVGRFKAAKPSLLPRARCELRFACV